MVCPPNARYNRRTRGVRFGPRLCRGTARAGRGRVRLARALLGAKARDRGLGSRGGGRPGYTDVAANLRGIFHPNRRATMTHRDHGKQHHGHAEDPGEPTDRVSQGLRGQGCAVLFCHQVGILRIVVGPGDHDHQSGHRTDHDRIDKRTQRGHDALADGLFRLGGGMGDGRRSDTGLVGEGGPLDSDNQHTQETTVGRMPRKCLREDRCKRRPNLVVV